MSPAWLDSYLAGPALLRSATAGLAAEQLAAHCGPGRWSILEVVCHLADMEGVHAERIKRAIAEELPVLPNADENAWAAALAYAHRELAEELDYIAATRRQIARILAALPEGVRQRQGHHGESGPITVSQLVERCVRHLQHHLGFITAKRQTLGV